MATADILSSMKMHILDAYDAVEEIKGEVTVAKNIANLSGQIAQLTSAYPQTDWGRLYTSPSFTWSDITQEDYEKLGDTGDENTELQLSLGAVTKTNILAFEFGRKPTSTPDSFLRSCTKLISLSPIPQNITSIGKYFLRLCGTFNRVVTLPDTLTSIGEGFMVQCTKFNQELTVPSSVTQIGNLFLYGCSALNQPVNLQEGLITIGNGFLRNCTAFNKPITLPSSLTTIGSDFLRSATLFTQPLSLPPSVNSIGAYFMYFCNSFVGPLQVESYVPAADQYTLACTNNTFPMYATGVTIQGAAASTWKTTFPDSDTSPYRKIIVS